MSADCKSDDRSIATPFVSHLRSLCYAGCESNQEKLETDSLSLPMERFMYLCGAAGY